MSKGQRIGLVLAAVVVAVVAFVALNPGGDESDDPAPAAQTTTTETETETDTPTETETETEPPPAPAPTRISVVEGAVEGGPKTITAERGDTVRVIVSSDAPDELHLHGFDITRNAAPGKPANFKFEASIEGSFEMESHTAEDAGRDALVARVVVEPK